MKILLVEDQGNLSQFLFKALNDLRGNEVRWARTGQNAISLIRSQLLGQPFDIVITGAETPGHDSFDVIDAVRSENLATKVIVMLESNAEEGVRARVTKVRPDEILEKPFKLETFYAAIKKLAPKT